MFVTISFFLRYMHFDMYLIIIPPPSQWLFFPKTYEKKPRESILRAEFANAIDVINQDLSGENCLRFLHWDLHKHSRRYQFSSIYLFIFFKDYFRENVLTLKKMTVLKILF